MRRRIFYLCRPYHQRLKDTWFKHTAADKKGHCAAETAAWKHVERVLSRGAHPTQVFSEFGQGELEPKKEELHVEHSKDLAWATRGSSPRWERTIRIRVQDRVSKEVYIDEYVTDANKTSALFTRQLPEPRPLTTTIWYVGRGYHFHGEDSTITFSIAIRTNRTSLSQERRCGIRSETLSSNLETTAPTQNTCGR